MSDVEQWMKRLTRKGPFYLLDTKFDTTERWDHSAYNHETKTGSVKTEVPRTTYWVIWNDKEKTKLGSFCDYMYARYGVATRSVLNGDTPFDLWNGQGIEQATFDEMLKVRNNTSTLPHFDLKTLVGVIH